MPFLLKTDYGTQIKADLLNAVTDAQDDNRTDAELTAQQEIESYLRGRYDLSRIFIDVQPYNPLQQYNAGAVVSHGATAGPHPRPLLYVATRGTIGEMPGAAAEPAPEPEVPADPAAEPVLPAAEPEPEPTEPADPEPADPEPAPEPEPVLPAWELKDPRHALIKTYLIDCTLYLLHSRQNPRAVPQIRQDRYDAAIDWLKQCRSGKVSPGLPLLPDTAPDGRPNRESIRPRGGSGSPKLRNSY